MNALNTLFFSLAETSFRVSLILLPLLMARPLLRRFVGSRWLCLLWLIVLGRLLLPLPVESRWSVSNGWPRIAKAPVEDTVKGRVSLGPLEKAVSTPAPVSADVSPQHARHIALSEWLGAIWLAGMAVGFAGLGLRLWRTRRLALQTCPVTEGRLLDIYVSIPGKIRRDVPLRLTRALDVPTLAGLLRPQIWLPYAWGGPLTRDEIRHVLLHELGHLHRCDLPLQCLFAMARCVHWFNPFVWGLARCARLDRELACDAWVLSRGGIANPARYGSTLIKMTRMLSLPIRTVPGGMAMASGKRNLALRIAEIGGFSPRPIWRGLVGIIAVLAGLAAFSTRGVAGGESGVARTKTVAPVESPAPSLPSEAKIRGGDFFVNIEAKFLEFEDPAEFNEPGGILDQASGRKNPTAGIMEPATWKAFLGKLQTKQGVKVVSSPRMTIKTGQTGEITIVREMKYPVEWASRIFDGKTMMVPTAVDAKQIGNILDVQATVHAGGKTIRMCLTSQVVDFFRYVYVDVKNGEIGRLRSDGPETTESSKGDLPHVKEGTPADKAFTALFDEYKSTANDVRVSSGQTVVLPLVRNPIEQRFHPPARRNLVAFVTVRVLTPAERAEAEEAEAKAAEADPPAIIRPGDKAGFVRSPFAPDAAPVDTHGTPAGKLLKCPHTGKIFRVPAL